MMRRQLYKTLFGMLFGVLALLVVGCGSPGDSSPNGSITPSVSLEFFNGDGEQTKKLSATDPGTIRITLKTSVGEPAPNQFLTVTTTKGSFQNSDGTALTNSEGIAEFTLLAGDDIGAGIINVTWGDVSLDPPFSFQIEVPRSIKIGSFSGDVFKEGVLTSSVPAGQTLSLGGTAMITASLAFLDQGVYVPYTKPVEVHFSTILPTSVVDEIVYSQNGKAATTYRAGSYTSGSDTITAEVSIAGFNFMATVDIDLASPDIGTIAFVSADPEHLALNGTANTELPSASTVVFLVKDQAANPVHNAQVNFSLSTEVGGIGLLPQTAFTNSEGEVQVTVTSGDVPTSVRVRATVNDSQISTLSSNLVISTGLPDQNSFSLSADIFNPEAWEFDGETVGLTIRAADHFNNPVPDGTKVSFRTEGGSIDSTCSTSNGACSVEWRSQEPRPVNGRVTILATALGEESFIDTTNSNGRYESSVDFFNPSTDDMPEAFLDVNENGTWDFDEDFLDYNQDGLYTDGNGMYNGTLCVEGCSNELIHVQRNLVIVMSSSDAVITFNKEEIDLDVNEPSISVTIEDKNGNSMPGGTAIALTAPENAEIIGEQPPPIKNTYLGPYEFEIKLKPKDNSNQEDDSKIATEGSLQVKVTSPKGTITIDKVKCTQSAASAP